MSPDQVYQMDFNRIYPLLVAKAERKGRSRQEVDTVICWLTGYDEEQLKELKKRPITYEAFFAQAPARNPIRTRMKGVVCGVRVEEIQEPLMQEIRYLDKLVDELARGKALEKILRS